VTTLVYTMKVNGDLSVKLQKCQKCTIKVS